MSEKDKPMVPSERDIKNKIEDVKELYRRADLAHGGFSEPGDGVAKLSGKPPRFDEHVGAEPPSVAKASPRWILEVLADMSDLAKNEDWSDLYATLEDMRSKVEGVLDRMEAEKTEGERD